MAVKYTGPTGLLSHGGPGSLFQLRLGQPALPALCCLPLVLPAAWTVALRCGRLLSTDTLLKHCCLSSTSSAFALVWISCWPLDLAHHARGCQWSPGPTLLQQIPITGQVVFTQFPKTPEENSPLLFDSHQLHIWLIIQDKWCLPQHYQGKKERSGITSCWATGAGGAPARTGCRR